MIPKKLSVQWLCCCLAMLALGCLPSAAESLMRAPAGTRYVSLNPTVETVLPNGRLITPAGKMYRVRPHPYGLDMSPDGRWVVAVSSDGPQLSILDTEAPGEPALYFIPDDLEAGEGVLDAAFMGLDIDPQSGTLYVAGGRDWSVTAFDLEKRERLFRVRCAHEQDGTRYEYGYTGDLVLSADGKTIYALDQSNFRMLVLDVASRRVIKSTAVGRYPFGIALSPDGQKAFVANVGMYEYAYLTDASGARDEMPFPPFGVPSVAAEAGVVVDGVVAAPLGDPNDLRSMSVWTLDLRERGAERVIAKSKTGHLVDEQLEDFPAVGGSSPNSMAVTAEHVYVSNGSNDSITVLDAHTGQRKIDIDLKLDPRVDNFRGLIPFGVALSPDETHLYVAAAGINAVAAIRLRDHTVIGYLPTAWFPSKLAVSPDGSRLYVACAKGVGSGPNAGPGHAPGDPTSIGSLMRGYIHALDLPDTPEAWRANTAKVLENNVQFYAESSVALTAPHPVPLKAGAWKSPIKHVLYVTKENRTFDEIFGALPGVRGDKELCRLGRPIRVSNAEGTRHVDDVVLMPNHIALARRFAINDNFYCDSDHSVDGHRWLVGTYPNEFMEAKIGESARGNGPGNFAFIGSSGAIYPEDYNEAGSIWEHFARNEIDFFNFGLGFEFSPQKETQEYRYTGIRQQINYPMPQALFENTSRTFATYNTNIPDQFRMDMFERHFNAHWVSGKEPFPQVVTVMLPNDHGDRERPDDGYPFWGSYMSDNDLALGRLVELVSHSPFWKDTVIFVTEDDAQGYRDTVDAHRSICMVISPYAKRDYISSVHASFGSILKTMFRILGLPPLNQYDAFSSGLEDMFTEQPANIEPYRALPVNVDVFDPQKALDPFDEDFRWEAMDDFTPIDSQTFLDTDAYGNAGPTDHAPRPTP